jgi:hypothetical protein
VSSGVGQVVKEGRNGFLVPLGEVRAFAARLEQLAANRDLAQALGAAAFQTLRTGPYSSAHTARRYLEVFENCREEVEQGRFKRPRGRMRIPAYYRLTTRVGRRLRKLLIPGNRPSTPAEPAASGNGKDIGK